MIIDHLKNPLGIIKKFDITYIDNAGVPKKLIGQIRALTEEGYTEANWFEFKVLYPKSDIIPHDTEIGGNLDNYKQLSKGTPNPETTERALVNWCKKLDFDITQVLVQEEPVHPNYA